MGTDLPRWLVRVATAMKCEHKSSFWEEHSEAREKIDLLWTIVLPSPDSVLSSRLNISDSSEKFPWVTVMLLHGTSHLCPGYRFQIQLEFLLSESIHWNFGWGNQPPDLHSILDFFVLSGFYMEARIWAKNWGEEEREVRSYAHFPAHISFLCFWRVISAD